MYPHKHAIADAMSSEQRLNEVAELLANGIVRWHYQPKNIARESEVSLGILPDQSVHTPTPTRRKHHEN